MALRRTGLASLAADGSCRLPLTVAGGGCAIQMVSGLLGLTVHHATPTSRAGLRLDVADYLRNAGRCADTIVQNRSTWGCLSAV